MQILEIISLILCAVIFIVILAIFKFIAIELANQQSHKCKKCGGDMKVVDFYIFPDSNDYHCIIWYKCPTCGMVEEIYY